MATEKNLNNLVINKVESQDVYNYMKANSLINADELYFVEGDTNIPEVTETESGLMSAADKVKLNGIQEGAEQNVQADWNVTDVNSDAYIKNKPTTLPADGGDSDTVNGHTVEANVPADAKFTDTVYTHPNYTAKTNGLYKITVDDTGHVSGTNTVTKADITALGIPAQDTTYSEATTSAAGLMSASDKVKLNGIAEGAEKNIQADWNQNDSTAPDYVKNRTHGCVSIEAIDITWDGNTSGRVSVDYGNGYMLYKVSDKTPSYEQVMNATIVVDDSGTPYTGSELGIIKYENCFGSEPLFVVFANGANAGGITFPESGTYFGVSFDLNVSSLSSPAIETVYKLDSKYLNLDTSPTSGSLNPVTSNGIKKYIDESISGLQVVTTSGTGSAYTATVTGITSLTAGISFIIIPHVVSTSATPTLNVNGLGAKTIRRRLSAIATGVQSGYTTSWLAVNIPYRVIYDGTYWIVEGNTKPSASDLYGAVPVEKAGVATGGTAGQVLAKKSGTDYDVEWITPAAEITTDATLTQSGAAADAKAVGDALANIVTDVYSASTTAPSNTKLLWIDTGNGGIMKYYNGSAWVAIASTWG